MKISQKTRRNILDSLKVQKVCWYGQLGPGSFLERVYGDDLKTVSYFYEGPDGLITRILWAVEYDESWNDSWIYSDDIFHLISGKEEIFLNFICELINPIVRPDLTEVKKLIKVFNSYLKVDGWEVFECAKDYEGRPIYAARNIDLPINDITPLLQGKEFNTDYVKNQILSMESSLENSTTHAVGLAKDFIETICKTILHSRNTDCPNNFIEMVKITRQTLGVYEKDILDNAETFKIIQPLFGSLGTITKSVRELRSQYGSGHGKEANFVPVEKRYARLAVNAAITLGVFLFETFQEQEKEKDKANSIPF